MKFDFGQVVYYVKDLNSGILSHIHSQSIGWGVVEEVYSDGYGLGVYEVVDARMIDGIPIAEYEFNQKRRKLPKGWTYNTKLFEVTNDPKWEKVFSSTEVNVKDPESLKHLIDIGALVRPSSQDKAMCIEEDINKDGWTIVGSHKYWKHNQSDYVCLPSHKLYNTYDKAEAVVNAYTAELKRIAELSDYDWSVEQIDKILDKWHGVYEHSEQECKNIKEFLLGQDNVEDIDVRITGGGLQWKYNRNKKWITILDEAMGA